MNKRLRSKIWSVTLTALFSTFIYIPQASATACSPTTTTYGSYTVLSFTTTTSGCTWTAPSDMFLADILIIGGGGGGGGTAYAGGGGGGGFAEKTNQEISPGSSFTIVVGDGGNGGSNPAPGSNIDSNGQNGQDSKIVFPDAVTITATGGGYGAGYDAAGSFAGEPGGSGGSGGGSSENNATSAASTQQSFSGWTTKGNIGGLSPNNKSGFGHSNGSKAGGGGGGAGSAGSPADGAIGVHTGGAGGSGFASSIRTGSAITYSAGGDGGSNGNGTARTNEAANTGNGGDGANWNGTALVGAKGGSGIVVFRYIPNYKLPIPQIWLGKYSIDCPLPNPSENELIQTANKITPVTASSENLVGKNISQETLDLVGQNEIYFDFWSNKVKTATIELPTYGCSDKLVRVKQNSSVQFIAGGFNLQSEARGYLQTPEGTWFDLTGVTLTKDTAAFLHTIKFVQPGKYLIVLSEQPDVDQHKIPTYGYKNARFVLEVSKKKSSLSTSSEPAKTSNAQSIALENLETVAQVSPWQEKNSNPIYLYLLIITLFSFLYFVNKKPALSNYPEINIEDKFANFIEEMYSNIKINK